MPKARKKPVVIDYVKYDGKNTAEVITELGASCVQGEFFSNDLFISTLEGVMRADPGDYIIKGIKGEIYPCKPDIFEATYELVE